MPTFVSQIVRKLAFEAKYGLGLAKIVPAEEDIIINGRNLLSVYLSLYPMGGERGFRRLARVAKQYGAVLPKYERVFREYIFPLLYDHAGALGGEPLALDVERVEVAAQAVGDAFLGKERLKTIRGWLCDDRSRRLLDLEVLQQALIATGWHPACACKAVCTGLSQAGFRALVKKGRRDGFLNDFVGLGGLRGWLYNGRLFDAVRTHDFVLGQYEYGGACEPRRGDVFFDCGGFWGDTAVWAMDKVSDGGTVVSFEPICAQAKIARENVRRHLGKQKCRVVVEEYGVSDRGGVASFAESMGTTRQIDGGGTVAKLVRLDDWCYEHGLYPDYVKMDIEGGELAALRGGST